MLLYPLCVCVCLCVFCILKIQKSGFYRGKPKSKSEKRKKTQNYITAKLLLYTLTV